MHRLFALSLSALVVLAFLGTTASARVMETGDATVVRRASAAVVNIAEWKTRASTQPGQPPRRIKVYASGFVIDPSGIIVTNKHVVDGALDMHVIFSNGDRVPARLLVAGAMADVAVIKVDVDHPLPALKWADSDALQVGDAVLTMGNPLGLGMSVSAGIISALNRNLHDTPFDDYIQTDAAINFGNSGGPLIDHNGDVVGIDTALYNPDANGGSIGIGFAIPSNIASFVVRFLLNPDRPKPGWIGVTLQDLDERLADAMGVQRASGAIISAIDPSGPAGHADLRPADVLEAIDGAPQSDSRAFMRAIVRMSVGRALHLTFWRDGRKLDTTVSVAAWPNYTPTQGLMRGEAVQHMIEAAPDPGMRIAAITDEARAQYGLDPSLTGALVSAVEQDCEARELGIVPGDVITNIQGAPVASPDDVRRAIEAAHQAHRAYLAMLIHNKTDLHWVSLSITSAGS